MQYLLLIYDDEQTWAGMSDDERGQVMQEYFAYTEELSKSGKMVERQRAPADADREDRPCRERREGRHRRPLRRDEGAARRVLPRRGRQRGRGARVGREDPLGALREDRGAPDRRLLRGRRHRRSGLRGRRPPLPRGVGGRPRPPGPRPRRLHARRGRGAGGVRRRARALAGGRPAREPGRLDRDHRAQPGDRPAPPRPDARAQDRAAGRARDGTRERPRRRSPTSGSPSSSACCHPALARRCSRSRSRCARSAG